MSMEYLRRLRRSVEPVEGSADEAELRYLAALAAGPRVKTIAQIGFDTGFSAYAFLEANPDAVLYSFDNGTDDEVGPAAEHIAATFPGRSVLIYGDPHDTVPEFSARHPQTTFDVILVAGARQSAAAVRQHLLDMRALAHPGTVVVIDDVLPWRPNGAGRALAWADLLAEGVLTCDELWRDGARVDMLAPPGRRAWAVGRFLPTGEAPAGGGVTSQQRARDLELAQAVHDPKDAQSTQLLARSYFDRGDFANAREWYARRVAMGGSDEAVYHAKFQLAESMALLELDWPDVEDAYLDAWEFRPTRAEPLYAIARRYRIDGRYRLGYFFAERAAQMPFPAGDRYFRADVYTWRAADEQAICAAWLGNHAEAFRLCRAALSRPDLPDDERARIAVNRDFSVPAMLETASAYPQQLVADLTAGSRDDQVAVSLVVGRDPAAIERSLNSFLNCCTDVARVGRFVVLDAGLSARDRTRLGERYGFIEFVGAGRAKGPGGQLGQLRGQIDSRYWLHLGQGWRFFAPEAYITRLTAVLEAEPQVLAVGVNFADAVKLTGVCADEASVRRTEHAGRYVLADTVAIGPAMFDTARLDQIGGMDGSDPDALSNLGRRATAAGMRTASLDEVLCSAAV